MLNSSDLVKKVTPDETAGLPMTITREQWNGLFCLLHSLEHKIATIEATMEARHAITVTTEHALEIALGAMDDRMGHLERDSMLDDNPLVAHVKNLCNAMERFQDRLTDLEAQAVRYSKPDGVHRHLVGRE